MKLSVTAAVLLAIGLSSQALAGVKAECEAGLDRDGAPPAVKAGCGCVETETAGNDALQIEFIRISQLPQSERMQENSPEILALMQKCFANPQ